MYGSGSATGPIVAGTPVVAGVTTAALLPQTGANLVVEIALAAAATLVAWAIIYVARAKFATR